MDWTREEVEAIVADYLHMLTLELSGQQYNKAQHRRNLRTKLEQRSDGAVEFKHCNISAVMIDLGVPSIRGYQPRGNYQRLLADVVEAQVGAASSLDVAALSAVQQPAITPIESEFANVRTAAPTRQFRAAEREPTYIRRAVKRDYLEREARNRSLGLAGEEFVVQLEHWRLNQMGMSKLADRVEHVSQTKGDGLGYDVLSFEANGRERLIEVKTTSFARETPFFVTKGELELSQEMHDQFRLYRLFEFRQSPRMFELSGALNLHCELDAVTYRASFG